MTMNPIDITPAHLRALARKDFAFFARGGIKELHPAVDISWNWHMDMIASRLTDVLEGRVRRLIINIPPRYGKSMLASVTFPAFILGNQPEAEIICMSYAYSLSEKMADLTRRLMTSRFYRDTFGPRLVSSRARLSELKTRAGGSRLATSVGGTLTGRGGNFLIVDDALKPSEAHSEVARTSVNDWFRRTVFSRTNDKEKGAIVIIMQRLHEDDLVGHLVQQGGWTVLSLPAIAEEDETHVYNTAFGTRTFHRKAGEVLHLARQSLESLEEDRRNMGPYEFAAQCQQRPAPIDGGLVNWKWFPTYDPANPPQFIRKVQSWDTAATDGDRSDYSVCVTLGETSERHWYVIDVFRARLLFPDLKRKLRELAELHRVSTVLIEHTSSGIQLSQELRGEGFASIQAIKPIGSKYERLISCTAKIEGGKVWMPNQAHWLAPLESELCIFPNGRYDDQVDALSQGILWMSDSSGPAYWLWAMGEVERMRAEGK